MELLIHKVQWQLKAPTQNVAVEAQKNVSDLMNSPAFLAELEAGIVARIGQNAALTIDKLEVELGVIKAKRFQTDAPKLLSTKLEEELEAAGTSSKDESLQEQQELDREHLFFYFLTTGSLHQSTPSRISSSEQFLEWLFQGDKEALAKNLISTIATSEALVLAISQWPIHVFRGFVKALRSTATESLLAAEAIESRRISEENKQKLRKAFWMSQAGEHTQVRAELMVFKGKMNASIRVAIQSLKGLLEQDDVKKASAAREPFIPISSSETKEYFISNAGSVLVAPLLPQLFERLGLLEEKKITSPERALGVLCYLYTGTEAESLIDFALYKLLIGLPLSEKVIPYYSLKRKEKKEINTFLTQLIKHWSALKNSSPAGLRNGFFNRNGLITTVDHGYALKVEARAQDILLAQLPWGIGTIKLPWMKAVLHVDWA